MSDLVSIHLMAGCSFISLWNIPFSSIRFGWNILCSKNWLIALISFFVRFEITFLLNFMVCFVISLKLSFESFSVCNRFFRLEFNGILLIVSSMLIS